MDESSNVPELQQQSKIADAELGVAEELGGFIAILAALIIHLKGESWLLSIAAGIATYVFVVYRYRRKADAAEDSYFRQAGLGNYACKCDDYDVQPA